MIRWLSRGSLIVALFLLALGAPAPALAQGPCGVVDAIDYPLDPERFGIAYPFGQPSSRYDGRLHTGEDWFGGRATTYGSPVRAIAAGRVTYAAPFGWGRDKGVVILEHLMPDGTWWYSLYGHMEELNGYTFPAVFTCVERGAIIGAVGRPRPAPHLHFEIRNFGPDSPGPGYWGTDPVYSGWRNPSQFIQNWRAWLHPAHAWHAELTDDSGPRFPAIIRADNATIVFDDGRLKALNPAGAVLWRYIMAETLEIVAVTPYEGSILVADYGGILQRWSLEGGFIEQWRLPTTTNDAVFTWGNLLVVHDAASDTLIAYGPDRAERWRVPDIPRPVSVTPTDAVLGVMSIRGALTVLGPDGRIIDRATLRGAGDLTPALDGGLIVRSRSALWHVDPAGHWQRLADAPPVQQGTVALYSRADGRFFLYSGLADQTLYAYDAAGRLLWQTVLPDLKGRPFLLAEGDTLLLADGYGQVITVDLASGAVCDQLRVWGGRAADAWAALGPDGILRLHIADQMIGLKWAVLTDSCH